MFNVLINDLEERLACNIIRFSDDVKLGQNPCKGSPVCHSSNWDEKAYSNLMKLDRDKFNVLGMRRKEPLQ